MMFCGNFNHLLVIIFISCREFFFKDRKILIIGVSAAVPVETPDLEIVEMQDGIIPFQVTLSVRFTNLIGVDNVDPTANIIL